MVLRAAAILKFYGNANSVINNTIGPELPQKVPEKPGLYKRSLPSSATILFGASPSLVEHDFDDSTLAVFQRSIKPADSGSSGSNQNSLRPVMCAVPLISGMIAR